MFLPRTDEHEDHDEWEPATMKVSDTESYYRGQHLTTTPIQFPLIFSSWTKEFLHNLMDELFLNYTIISTLFTLLQVFHHTD